jgi:predicted Kef-type K+ transport protein
MNTLFDVKRMKKKGSIFSEMGNLATGIAVLVIVLVVAFLVMAKTKTQIASTDGVSYSDANGSLAWNATRDMQNNTYSIVGWVGLVVIVGIGILILGLVRQIRQ